ncbi:hypothetical protein HDU97_003144 [Phlyctochytrium planicorne]|nr:hypothetical protein HDU97_003144 [Phlyctochytrium planicorne]
MVTSAIMLLLLPLLLPLLLTVPSVNAASCFKNFNTSQFMYCQVISPIFALHWSISQNNSVITFGADWDIKANGTFFGFGLSEFGGMRGADLTAVYMVDNNGAFNVTDYFSSDFTKPTIDESQDVLLVSPPSPINGNFTTYILQRPLVTCDPKDIPIQKGILNPIVWATGVSTLAKPLAYHGTAQRGNANIILYPDPAKPWQVSTTYSAPGVQTMEVRMPNITINSSLISSSYCTHFSVPADKKYHVVSYNGLLNATANVHGINVYGCSGKPAAFNDVYECFRMDELCDTLLYTWIPGSTAVHFPTAAGSAIGTGTNAFQYLSLQVRYNNPYQIPNIIDNSGMTLNYTAILRSNDIGVLTLGQEMFELPKNSSGNYIVSSKCSAACTSKFPSSITLVLFQLYTHVSDDTSVVNPGDVLVTTCGYRPTTGLLSNVKFGEAPDQETCYNYIYYYPRMTNIDFCSDVGTTGICTTRTIYDKTFVASAGDSSTIIKSLGSANTVENPDVVASPYVATCTASYPKLTAAVDYSPPPPVTTTKAVTPSPTPANVCPSPSPLPPQYITVCPSPSPGPVQAQTVTETVSITTTLTITQLVATCSSKKTTTTKPTSTATPRRNAAVPAASGRWVASALGVVVALAVSYTF